MGLVIKKFHYGIRYTPNSCFKKFGDGVSDARRLGDKDPSKAIIAETEKLKGNSSYGKTVTNKENHTNVQFVKESKVDNLVAKHTFKGLNQIGEDTYEISQFKSKIKMDLPLQIGVAVYQYAKLRMLDFFFNCVDKFVDRSDYVLSEMDTDSNYFGFSKPTFEECIKPEMKEQWEEEKYLWFPRTASKGSEVVFNGGDHEGKKIDDVFYSGAEGWEYCEEVLKNNEKSEVTDRIQELVNQAYDKRTPGLFKVEFSGIGIVALCSKTYICWDEKGKSKFSCKGVNKKINDVIKEKYLKVLATGKAESVKNRGFRVIGNEMLSYSQVKVGFSYLYPKRKVLACGKRTEPLDI